MNHRELISALTPLHGAGEARAIVRMVMEERFGLSQTDLLLGKDSALSSSDRSEFEKIAQRLLSGEPVQHVLGYAFFCSHRFRVGPEVLIPRPETEELVGWCLSELPPCGATRVLDLCTGSGCIAVSLALALPDACVVGVDVSPSALAIARENAEALGTANVSFVQQDILGETAQFLCPHPPFSALTANPPYVRESEAADMHPTVLDHEPSIALFVPDEDPLRFYRSIARLGIRVLVPGGLVFVEINAALAEETRDLFAAYGYTDLTLRNDQFGRPRMLKAANQS